MLLPSVVLITAPVGDYSSNVHVPVAVVSCSVDVMNFNNASVSFVVAKAVFVIMNVIIFFSDYSVVAP